MDYFLRDHLTGNVRHFDPRLFDLLHDLTESLDDAGGEIDVICGYRTPRTNEFLRTRLAKQMEIHVNRHRRFQQYLERGPVPLVPLAQWPRTESENSVVSP